MDDSRGSGGASATVLVLLVGMICGSACGPSGSGEGICEPDSTQDCTCLGTGDPGVRICALDGMTWSSCDCRGDAGAGDGGGGDGSAVDSGPAADGEVVTFCSTRADGTWCEADELVSCLSGVESQRAACPYGCDDSAAGGSHACAEPNPNFCVGLLNGLWCDGDDLVYCLNDVVDSRETCANGCLSMPVGTPDECAAVPFCTAIPNPVSPTAPTDACNYMDWELSPDGFYLISRFGTTNDPTTLGHTTSCGFLQGHYDYHGCRYDNQTSSCLDNDTAIPWVQHHVDYVFQDVIDEVDLYAPGDVPNPDIFYVAGAQRFNCGAVLRVSNPGNSRCVMVYAEDGGPGATYEGPSYGARRILDASPAVSRFLAVTQWGWANADMVYVEWGLAGDVPGHACVPCQSTPVETGTESMRPPYDVNHMLPGLDCRP